MFKVNSEKYRQYFYRVSRVIFLPIFLLRVVVGFLLALLILPAQYLYPKVHKNHLAQYKKISFFESFIHSIRHALKYNVITQLFFGKEQDQSHDLSHFKLDLSQNHVDSSPKKLVCVMYGNADSHTNRTDKDLWSYYKKLPENTMLVAMDPPGVQRPDLIWNQNQLIEKTLRFVNHQMYVSGVSPENVTLVGSSLGGAIMMQVAARLHNAGSPVHMVADRTFSDLPTEVIYMFGLSALKAVMVPIFRCILWCTFGTLNSLKASKHIAQGYLQVLNASHDAVIPHGASLYQGLHQAHSKHIEYASCVNLDEQIKQSCIANYPVTADQVSQFMASRKPKHVQQRNMMAHNVDNFSLIAKLIEEKGSVSHRHR